MSLTLKSPAFSSHQPIPPRYTQDAANISPPLTWSGVPENAQALALVVDDPDAPREEPFVHWVLYNIPPTISSLHENIPRNPRPLDIQGAMQGENSFGQIGYRGPAPPPGHGTHHYHFHLYALDVPLPLPVKADPRSVKESLAGHILAEADLIGTYRR